MFNLKLNEWTFLRSAWIFTRTWITSSFVNSSEYDDSIRLQFLNIKPISPMPSYINPECILSTLATSPISLDKNDSNLQLQQHISEKQHINKIQQDQNFKNNSTKESIVGVRDFGMATATCMTIKKMGMLKTEIIMNVSEKKLIKEVLAPHRPESTLIKNTHSRVNADYSVTVCSKVCSVTAEKMQYEGTLDLITRKTKVVKRSPETFTIITTSPADVLSYVMRKFSGIKELRVIGSRRLLNSAHARCLLSESFGDFNSCDSFIICKNGNSMEPALCGFDIPEVHLSDLDQDIGKDKNGNKWKSVHATEENGGKVVKSKDCTSWVIRVSVSKFADTTVINTGTIYPFLIYIKKMMPANLTTA